MCLDLNSAGHPIKRRELKVLEGTHETDPMGVWGVEVGLEKQ